MGFDALAVVVFLVFLILKVTHHIAWSWWVVCSPLLALGAILVLGLAALGFGARSFFKRFER